MKISLLVLCLFSFSAVAEDPNQYLKNFDGKIYSLKTKGVKDFVVEIESSNLTKQINDQKIFGKVKNVIFKTYWTANPERLAVEVEGLPEGFKEVKEQLKVSLMSVMDNLIPQTMAQKFAGYKFVQGKKPREIIAQDTTGIAETPSFTLVFDAEDRLTEVIGHRPIGEFVSKPRYQKEAFADGKWAFTGIETVSSAQGQSLTLRKDVSYTKSEGMGVVKEVSTSTEQKNQKGEAVAPALKESVTFKNYKINTGDALKYFLGESGKEKQKIVE
ncbi:MAG TPA: hypothetical protein VNJ01_12875 [Bacteriovoracaceae bacterium]|nr:hypothetical protein [Bacteriovoracaceae bacterium]